MLRRNRFWISLLIVFLTIAMAVPVAGAAKPSQPTAQAPTDQLSVDEAATVALWFIANDRQNPESRWTANTRISKVTTLFNENEQPTGYVFELQTGQEAAGYVVVAASSDMSLIQEWSYTAKPLFYFNADQFDRVYYTAPLEYTVRSNGKYISSFRKAEDKEKLKDRFKRSAEKAKANVQVLSHIRAKGLLKHSEWMVGYNGQISGQSDYGGIYDPYTYVNDRYGSGWTLTSSKTLPVPAYLQSDLEPNANNCTLSALTMVFAYYRDYKSKTNIPTNRTQLYSDIRAIAVNYGYTPQGGTNPWYISDIAKDVWKKYGYNHSSTSWYVWTYSSFTSETDAGRAALINIGSGYYSNHSVVLTGYRTYSKTLNPDKGFLKVNDNWTTADRYIDYAQFVDEIASITSIYYN